MINSSICGTVVGHGSGDHKRRSYKIIMTKTRHTITRMKRHVKTTPISAEDYLRKEMSKANLPQTDDKLNELIDCFALQIQHEHFNNLQMEGRT